VISIDAKVAVFLSSLLFPVIQGGSKFCGFEFFKQKFATMAGSREVAQNNRTLIYMGAASSAELIASTLLTPLEAARIRLVSSRSYANGLVGAMTRMAGEGGLREFYAGKSITWNDATDTLTLFL
jgi:solute carrier family 25 phosphate transporter 3